MPTLKSPYPWFGGKSRVSPEIWRRLGNPGNLIVPFFGSGAELLGRPGEPGIETVNDKDCNVPNFWRAVSAEPDALAEILSWPVSQVDLEARHKALVRVCGVPACKTGESGCGSEECKWARARRLHDDPTYFNITFAGWWCWGLCCWIGSGWCAGEWWGRGNEWNHGDGINVQDEERGGKRPHLGNAGKGVQRQRPHLGDAGNGVHRGGNGTCAEKLANMKTYMHRLADRLRNVRVCCGDWTRVMGPSVTFKHGVTGIILDPPYSAEAGRDNSIYTEEDTSVAHDVREWCIENGGNRDLLIALCGYEGEHEELESLGWAVHAWKAHGGYGVQSFGKNGSNRGSGEYTNKLRERVWFSPAARPQRQLEFAAEVW